MNKEKRRLWFSIVSASLLLMIIIFLLIRLGDWSEVYYQKFFHRSQVDIYFLDVGQGDATLFYTDNRQTVLVDGGPDLSVLYGLGRALPFYEKTIDLLVLTHPDSDHVNGLVEVTKRYQVNKVLYTGVTDDLPAYQLWQKILKQRGIEVVFAQAGQHFDFGSLGLEVLYPQNNLWDQVFRDNNSSSLVLKFSVDQVDFLLTGDLPAEQELELLEIYSDLDVEVIKAGHHGSKTSTSREFLAATTPAYVIISTAADNTYGHPHFVVIQRIMNTQAQILRTDQLGTIRMVTQGENIEIK